MARIKAIYDKNGNLYSYCITVFKGRTAAGKEIASHMTMKVDPHWSEEKAKSKAVAAAAIFEKEILEGTISDSRQTFQEYADYVIGLKKARGVKPSTINGYKHLTSRIYPAIGNIKLKNLKPSHLNNFYSALTDENNKNYSPRAYPRKVLGDLLKQKHLTRKALSDLSGVALHTVAVTINGKDTYEEAARKISAALGEDADTLFTFTFPTVKISSRTIKEHHRFIHMVLAQAVKEGLVPNNVADRVEVIRTERPDVNYFTIEQLKTIEEKLEEESPRWCTIAYMYMTTGCRRGEILALKWNDIDLEKGQVNIHANLLYEPGKGLYIDTPKTKNSNRIIAIPHHMVKMLKQYRIWQLEERMRLGEFYEDKDFVFAKDDGSPIHPNSVTHWMEKFGEKCGFKVNAHAFRHSMASLLCYSGLDIVSISKRLGHADVSTTTDIYAHLMEKIDKKSSDMLANILFSEAE